MSIRRPWPTLATIGALLALLVLAAWRLDLPWSRLAPEPLWRAVHAVIGSMWPGDVDGAFWQRLAWATWETLAMSLASSVLAVGLALLLLPWASTECRRDGGGMLRHHVARLFANTLRTTPFLVWALVLVAILGPGPTAGTLALTLHTAGVLSRLYAQAIDDTPSPAALALRAAGAAPTTVLWLALVPTAAPRLFALAAYRWEVALREASVLGFVGAGGLGTVVMYAIGTFDRPGLGAAVLVIIALVAAAEATSALLRRRWR